MATTFFVLFCLGVFHFVYEGIILPSIRMNLRFKLFSLRDRVRNLKVECGTALNDEIYHLLENSINTTIKFLHRVDVSAVVDAHRTIETDEELRKRAGNRKALFDKCQIAEVRDIEHEHFVIWMYAFSANMGGWFIYFLPPVLCLMFIGKVLSILKTLFLLDERDLENILPQNLEIA